MDAPFRVRLNCVDHYQSAPTTLDPPLFGPHGSTQHRQSPQIPVIRVFGATETGQKVCAHIHGALPYLFIEYRGSLDKHEVDTYVQNLRSSIDHALAVSYRRNVYDGKAVFVGHISLVKGVPFYGYHVGYRYFLKIYMLNPLNMTRFADLLYQGAIMGQPIQPFEAHLQYLLQWMCDFNLYGCSYIDAKVVKFRHPIPGAAQAEHTRHQWHAESIPDERILNPDEFPRQSHCALEVDICVEDILNRDEVQMRDLHADFIERFNQPNPDEKLVLSLAGLWRDETKRRKRQMGLTDTTSSPFPPEVLVSMSADPRNNNPGGWIHEQEYRDKIKALIEAENQQHKDDKLTFDDFLKPDPLAKDVKTVLASVGDLFAANLMQNPSFELRPIEDTLQDARVDDESTVPPFEADDFPYDSDEDVARQLAQSQSQIARDDDKPVLEVPQEALTAHLPVPDDMTEREQWRRQRYALPSKRETQPLASISSENSAGLDITPSQEHAMAEAFGEFPDSDRPRKKRRVSIDEDLIRSFPLHTPRTNRRVAFTDVDNTKAERPEYDDPPFPISSQPLSQASIKSSQNSTIGFPVAKGHHIATATSKSQPTSQKSAATPLSAIRDRAHTISLKTPNVDTSPKTSSTLKPSSSSPLSSQAVKFAKGLGEFDSTGQVFCFGGVAPTYEQVETTLEHFGRPPVIYQDAYYSNEKDVPERARDYAGREFKLQSDTVPFLPDFDPSGESLAAYGQKPPILVDFAKEAKEATLRSRRSRLRHWEYAPAAPSYADVEKWLRDQQKHKVSDSDLVADPVASPTDPKRQVLSQIEGPTQHGKHGSKFSQRKKSTSVRHETQYMSTMSLEVHVNSRHNLAPNPDEDEVACIFWCIKSDEEGYEANGRLPGTRVGVLALADETDLASRIDRELAFPVEHEETELDLINRLIDIVREFDPDILTGYEVHNGSWGYLMERARVKYEYNLCDELSRMKSQSHGRFGKDADRWGFNTTSTIRVTGRHMINIWRAMRSELNLLQYTMENVAFHVLHKRIPHYAYGDLTEWYTSKTPSDLAKVLDYFVSRVQMNLEILDANELIARTSEQARLIGVDFFSVFSRGSQFKVESFMFRIAKPENFLLVSPSRKQVGQQNALECLPLVMEPQSDFYTSPLVVLDFQSLYPSIMIAYNYCYSTCLGRVVPWRGQNKLGFADFARQPGLLGLAQDQINVAPNGLVFVKPAMRKSLLAKMLSEILETRVMVKSGMKVDKDDKTLQQLLNNRQLALKLLANVTYGYTSASFSGRMPASEIADAIVQTGRETLERSIALIHSVERWGAEVVYGDTDSLFISLKGRTRQQAFDIGAEIAREVTAMNPQPMKLKFEKVYHPCVLLAKKRYVGFKYESPTQTEPDFDAKGIETVRRDGTPAEQKLEEAALKLLFRTADLSQVKAYFQRQCAKIMAGRVSVQDFCYAREVKLGTYADKGPPPPGALIATRRMLADPRRVPQYGERVPYVVVSGAPGARLIDRCTSPEALLQDAGLELDAEYYITKNLIPPLERIFNLVGANVRAWYDEMPKVQRIRHLAGAARPARRTLEGYMRSSHCAVCRAKLPALQQGRDVCRACAARPAETVYTLQCRAKAAARRAAEVEAVCRSCSGVGGRVRCDSKDCPVYYSRVKARAAEGRVAASVAGVVEGLEAGGDVSW